MLNNKANGVKMQTVYVLQAQGLGDDENAYVSIGVYNSKLNADNALQNFVRDFVSEAGFAVATRIDEFELNA
jgi:hypothetical protein